MFDSTMRPTTAGEVEASVSRLAAMDRDVSDAGRIEQIGLLERLKGAAAAACRCPRHHVRASRQQRLPGHAGGAQPP